jgi:hypothetical protein
MKARTYIRLGETCTLELYYQIPTDLFQWDDCTSVTCTLRRTPVVYDCSVVMHGRTPTGSLHTRTVSMYARALGPHCEPPSDSPRFLPDSIWSTCLVSVKVFHTFERRAAAITILVVIRVRTLTYLCKSCIICRNIKADVCELMRSSRAKGRIVAISGGPLYVSFGMSVSRA